jgi:peptide/nickel transport system permease protein
MPGDPIDALMAFGSPTYVQDNHTRAALAAYYHLDESAPQQYLHYLGRLVRGDLGVSIDSNRPVRKELGDRLRWSFLLIVSATVISIMIALPAGVQSGWKRNKGVDRGLLAVFLAWQNMPIYLVGVGAFLFLATKVGIFPPGGATTAFSDYHGLSQAVDVGRHVALPSLLLGLDFATFPYWVMRSSMVSELGSDYLLGGRAKGLPDRRLKYRYAARNALLQVVTVVGLQFGLAITSLIFIERIFDYPGVGGFMINSIGQRDYPAIQGSFLVLTLTVVTVNLLVDLLYRRLDPRVTT